MSDGIDLAALEALVIEARAGLDALDTRLQARRDEKVAYSERRLRADLSEDLWHAHNLLRRLVDELRLLRAYTAGEITAATSRDVAPEIEEADRG